MLVVAGALLVFGCSPAFAGNWMQAVCVNPNNSIASNQGWAQALSSDPQLEANAGFLTPDPGNTNDIGCMLVVLYSANPGDTAAFQYTPPATSTIDGGYLVQTTVNGAPPKQPTFIPTLWSPEGSNVNVLWSDFSSDESELLNQTVTIPAAPGGPDLYAGFYVDGYGTQNCPTFRCTFSIESGGILLANYSAPAGSDFGGSLLAAGSVHGTADLTFTATDAGGAGVYRVIVLIDGKPVYQGTPNTLGGSCVAQGTDPTSGAWIFDAQQPCPQTVDLDIPVNTTALRDGDHQLQVVVQDAAQNSSTVLDQTISTDNFTTVAGTTAENTTTLAGPGASYAFKLDPATAALTASTVHSRYQGSRMTLSGQVLLSGEPAPEVIVTVQAGSLSGAGYTTVSKTTTNAAGQFTLTVPRGDSRDLEITAGADNVKFQQLVTPNISLSVRSLPGARILFTGHVAIDTRAAPSPLVEIESYDPANTTQPWPIDATTTVAKNGSFRYMYRASPVLAGYRFKFRAATPPLTGYWQTAVSAVKEAKVTP